MVHSIKKVKLLSCFLVPIARNGLGMSSRRGEQKQLISVSQEMLKSQGQGDKVGTMSFVGITFSQAIIN